MKGIVPLRWRRVWAVTRWFAVAAALPLVWACNARTLAEPTPHRFAAARRIVTVAVIPETSGTPAGTSVIRMRTGTRCASRTQV